MIHAMTSLKEPLAVTVVIYATAGEALATALLVN